jgi:hypothetical protein
MIAVYVEQEHILLSEEKPCMRLMIYDLHISPLTPGITRPPKRLRMRAALMRVGCMPLLGCLPSIEDLLY